MRSNTLFAVLLTCMALTIGSAYGQTMARVHIPFDFSVGDSTLPAGEYTASPVFAGNRTVLAIRSLDGHQQIIVQTSAAETAKTPNENKMVFRHYGDQYFLSRIWVEGQALALPVGNREREMARSTKVQEASLLGK
jgi:hypothetical protein